MVPAVVCVLRVVRMESRSDSVLCAGSVRVGVVIVVLRLFSIRKSWNGSVSVKVSRSMLMSPTTVMEVVGDCLRLVSIIY